MANRRMFSMKIIDTDVFMDMPHSSQLLYFQLSMRADDDGFVASPKKIMRMIGSTDDDIKVLVSKRFVIPFESGVCVIKHWLIHNYIQSDRYTPTQWIEEKNQLVVNEATNKYQLKSGEKIIENKNVSKMDTNKIQNVSTCKVRLSKEREIEEISPSQEAKLFFNSEDNQLKIVKWLEEKGLSRDTADREVKKFINYWTELNKSGTKQRWELEKTFQVSRRLTTWFQRVNEFKRSNNKSASIII